MFLVAAVESCPCNCLLSSDKEEDGDEGDELEVSGGMSCKLSVNSYKMRFVKGSEDYQYRRRALKRAREVSALHLDFGMNPADDVLSLRCVLAPPAAGAPATPEVFGGLRQVDSKSREQRLEPSLPRVADGKRAGAAAVHDGAGGGPGTSARESPLQSQLGREGEAHERTGQRRTRQG